LLLAKNPMIAFDLHKDEQRRKKFRENVEKENIIILMRDCDFIKQNLIN